MPIRKRKTIRRKRRGRGWLSDAAKRAAGAAGSLAKRGAVAAGRGLVAVGKRGAVAAGGLAKQGVAAAGRGAKAAVVGGGKALTDVGRELAEHMEARERRAVHDSQREDDEEEYVLVRRPGRKRTT